MRSIIIFISICIAIVSCNNNAPSKILRQPKHDGLKGNIKEYTDKVYGVENRLGEYIPIELHYSRISIFNDLGNILVRKFNAPSMNAIDSIDVDKNGITQSLKSFEGDSLVSNLLIVSQDNNSTYYKKDGKEFHIYIDKNNLNIRNEVFGVDSSKYTFKKNKIQRLEVFKEGKFIHGAIYKYDNNDLISEIISQNEYSNKMDTVRLEYADFDSKGNWTKQMVFEKNNSKEPSGITIRTISYK